MTFFSTVGNDATAEFVSEQLQERGVERHLYRDDSRPTTLKQRYRASGKTLLRVSHLRKHDIRAELCERLFAEIRDALHDWRS